MLATCAVRPATDASTLDIRSVGGLRRFGGLDDAALSYAEQDASGLDLPEYLGDVSGETIIGGATVSSAARVEFPPVRSSRRPLDESKSCRTTESATVARTGEPNCWIRRAIERVTGPRADNARSKLALVVAPISSPSACASLADKLPSSSDAIYLLAVFTVVDQGADQVCTCTTWLTFQSSRWRNQLLRAPGGALE